jgi:hypothetical protein
MAMKVIETRRRGPFGKLMKGLFIAGNLVMFFVTVGLFWAFEHAKLDPANIHDTKLQDTPSAATLVFTIPAWFAVFVVTGILALITRGQKVYVQET